MKPLLALLALALSLTTLPSTANELTVEQIQSLKARLKAIKDNLETHITSRNVTAGQAFANAASDPRAAVELYLKCVKMVAVSYTHLTLPTSDLV